MSKNYPLLRLILALILLAPPSLQAQLAPQNQTWLPCASPAGKSLWLDQYQKGQFGPALSKANTLYLPLTLHIVSRNDGSGASDLGSIFQSFCQLNTDFLPTGIQFYIDFPLVYHQNTAYFQHDSVIIGGRMMLQHNRPNTINVYFVGSPAGACGYNLPYAGVAMNYACLFGHTFAHELGHNLSLPHTFLGWEGGPTWDNTQVPNFNRPAPNTVTYNYTDFKDTMWTDTLIIDTALVEMVARTGPSANCQIAADGFCDTPADYLAYRWFCNASGLSSVQQLDPDSVAFFSEGQNIMSYANDACQSSFSLEQAAAMRTFVQQRRQNLLQQSPPPQGPLDQSNFETLYPRISDSVPATGFRLTWSAVPGATHYLIQTYFHPLTIGNYLETALVTDTFFQTQRLYPARNLNFPYGWRVLPLNAGNLCGSFSPTQTFNTYNVPTQVLAQEVLTGFSVFPNPLTSAGPLHLRWEQELGEYVHLRLFSVEGRLLYQRSLWLDSGEVNFSLPLASWPAGWYVLDLRNEAGTWQMQHKIAYKP